MQNGVLLISTAGVHGAITGAMLKAATANNRVNIKMLLFNVSPPFLPFF